MDQKPVTNFGWIVIFCFSLGSLFGCSDSSQIQSVDSDNSDSIRFDDLYSEYVEFSIGVDPVAVSIGDVNNDNLNDVVLISGFSLVTLESYSLFVFLQNETGELNEPIHIETSGDVTNPSEALQIADINNDGLNEVVVGHLDSADSMGEIEIFIQDPIDVLKSVDQIPPFIISLVKIADVTNDGLSDLVSVDFDDAISIFQQTEDNDIASPISVAITHEGFDDIDIGDVNNDGLNDIVVMSGQGFSPDFGILLQGDLGFNTPPNYFSIDENGASASSLALGDLNDDGLTDIALSYNSSIGIYFQTSDNEFVGMEAFQFMNPNDFSNSIKVHDLNNDNKKDIVVSHGSNFEIETYLQTDEQDFIQQNYQIPWSQSISKDSIDVGDLNQDSKPDIAIAIDSGLAILYQQ